MQRGWKIEPPPPQYASGPTQTGQTNEIPNLTPEMAHTICKQAGTFSDQQQGYGVACYVPSMDAIVLPAAKYWPSSSELDQLRAHEWAHARGDRHLADGTGTDWSLSLPPVGWIDQVSGTPQPIQPGDPTPVFNGPAPPPEAIAAWAKRGLLPSQVASAFGFGPTVAAASPPPPPAAPPASATFGFASR